MGKIHLSIAALSLGILAAPGVAAVHTYTFRMNGAQEVPPVNTAATGLCTVTLDDATNMVSASCTYTGLSSNANNAHIHMQAPGQPTGGPIVNLTFTAATSGTASGSEALLDAEETAMIAGTCYVNIHSANNPGGEIRGQVVAEVPAVSTWGVVATTILLVIAATVVLYRKKHAAIPA